MKSILITHAFSFLSVLCLGQAIVDDSNTFLPEFASNKNIIQGKIQVPESHDNPTGKKIEIAYVVIKSQDSTITNYPIINFSGGPGGISLSPGFINAVKGSPLVATRDFILFDQRGINFSSDLTDISEALFNIMASNSTTEEEFNMFADTLTTYSEKCSAQGINLSSYNSFESARDIGMLMEHLGYGKYNLLGGSYGTRLARIVQDMYPEKINKVILDSPSHIEGDFLLSRIKGYVLALNRLLERCKSEPECSTKYPDLKNQYYEAVESCKNDPIEISYAEGKKYYINGQDAIYFLRRRLYSANALKSGPEFINALHVRDSTTLLELINLEYNVYVKLINTSMLLSVESYSQFDPNLTPEKIDSIYSLNPEFTEKLGFFNSLYIAGQNWHDKKIDRSKRNFLMSDIPTLIMVNHFDPATPPEEAYKFMKELSNGFILVFDQGGHGVIDGSECVWTLLNNFLDSGKVIEAEKSCLTLYQP